MVVVILLMVFLSRVGASDLRSLVGWLEKGVRSGEGRGREK